jgi:hypothetical protein
MNGIGSCAKVLDAKVRENNPEQLDKLHRYEKRPKPDSGILSFENQRC